MPWTPQIGGQLDCLELRQFILDFHPGRLRSDIYVGLRPDARVLVDRTRRQHDDTEFLMVDRDRRTAVAAKRDLEMRRIGNLEMPDVVEPGEPAEPVPGDECLRGKRRAARLSAARAMTDSGWRSVVVVDARGKPLGIFSGLDFLACCDLENIPDSYLVTDAMHDPLMIGMDASLQEAAPNPR